jgi:hypothetical protein
VADFDSSSVEYSGSVTRDLVLVMVEMPGGYVWKRSVLLHGYKIENTVFDHFRLQF